MVLLIALWRGIAGR